LLAQIFAAMSYVVLIDGCFPATVIRMIHENLSASIAQLAARMKAIRDSL